MLTQSDEYSPYLQDSPMLDDSYQFCHEAAKRNSSFYLGMLLTSKHKRNALLSIYTWLHALDDIADDNNFTQDERIERINAFHQKTLTILNEPSDKNIDYPEEKYWSAFRHTILKYHIPHYYLEGMIKGQQQDLVKDHYQTFNELYQYCYYVASTVGLMCISIWGYEPHHEVKQLAEWNGIAFQLTNILRDLKEDVGLHRVYLPADLACTQELTSLNFHLLPKENLMKAINELIMKTEEYYKNSYSLYKYIHRDGKLSFLVLVATYKTLFEKIRRCPEAILSGKRIRLTKIEKIVVLLKVLLKFPFLYWRKS